MDHELKEFGLTENEIKIYLALLRLGTANPVQIAEKNWILKTIYIRCSRTSYGKRSSFFYPD
ncbi:hypothetical protein HZB02_06950 [Candidatus Woesearchaeota archaeon]|nr:hypothetical protein [Candidatus Woesearchaeota archaeon]